MDPDGIPLLEEDHLYTAPSGLPCARQGLFTSLSLYKDEVIPIFHGEGLSAKEAAERAAQGLDRCFMELPDGTTLDAMGVEAQRCGIMPRSLDDNGQACLRATRGIR